ncbi:MAG: Asp-tRNA(Asn)/Glu-tRNA(Gln) amidotransferase subunit GatB [Alphaproteobacteria bacterium]|nr:Asp-tRNA(Asn)/Glu-tRNA(Gln) amidotransferase subunit GatB [Alphaproteobacteria bacterium]MBN2779505.1 Asp-tRNA(Asn)/Glu-tRNA(Gln) amidotransferase subunit GatB [Alphaproteobacteria bacterium]
MRYTIDGKNGKWEVVMGLEVHCQVNSASKLFSSSPTAFGAEPNTQVSYVDAAMPGMLPVINDWVVKQAIRTGLGLNAKINKVSRFARKNYFYPDLPQGYQISQSDQPIVGEGVVEVKTEDGGKRAIRIERLHLEQDAGKSMHDQDPHKTYVDLNRSGTPLMEIVSYPDITSPDEAAAYFKKIQTLVRYLGTSDGNMEEGSMRADVNVSVRPVGSDELRPRAEIKNMNSLRFIRQAIAYEAQRQVDLYDAGESPVQETRLFNPKTGETKSMRSKENAADYRYFPCPDLLPLILDDAEIEAIRKDLPELPDAKRDRFIAEYGVSEDDAITLSNDKDVAHYFETAVGREKQRDGKMVSNWILSELFGHLNKENRSITESPISAENLGDLVDLIAENVISGKIAKTVFEDMLKTNRSPKKIVEEKGLRQITDSGAIEKAIDKILSGAPDKVAEYKSGKVALIGWFVGQVMQATQGRANPGEVNKLLKEKLGE